MFRRFVPLLSMLSTLAACSGEADSGSVTEGHTGRVAEPIIDGTRSTASDDAVVRIEVKLSATRKLYCSGTLITPNLVLTAGHCVSEFDQNSACGNFTTQFVASSISISLGAVPGPAIANGKALFLDTLKSATICANDVALLQLDRDLPNAKLAKVRFTKGKAGEPARPVGYGDDGSGTLAPARLMRTGLTVDAVGPSTFTFKPPSGKGVEVSVLAGELATDAAVCHGDSGGPLLDSAGSVVGVTSRTLGDSCRDRPAVFTDTASHEQFITTTAVTAGHPLGETVDPKASPAAAPAPPNQGSSYRGQSGGGCAAGPGRGARSFSVLAGLAALILLTQRRRRR